MWFFRKSLDLRRASVRLSTAADLTHVSRLFRDGGRRYYALSGPELPGLLSDGWGVVLDAGDELWGVALVSWPSGQSCWLRGLALAEGAEPQAASDLLCGALHSTLAARGQTDCYYAGDETADSWVVPLLQRQGYLPNTSVVVYEKRSWFIPDHGNPDVQVRPAAPVDLAEVLRLDRLCFEPQWSKDDTVFGPALTQGPFFVLAELDGVAVGYAYATSHFGGRLMHLVRIAVDPTRQGARIGIRLLAALTEYAAAHHAEMITLNTQAYNTHAQRLYRWFGFTQTGEHQTILRRDLRV